MFLRKDINVQGHEFDDPGKDVGVLHQRCWLFLCLRA